MKNTWNGCTKDEAISLEEIQQRNGKKRTVYYERWVKDYKQAKQVHQKIKGGA